MLKTYDTTQAAFIERSNNKYYDATQGAWTDVPSVKSYDSTQSAWVERLYKYLTLKGYKAEHANTNYSILSNGITCNVYGVSEDYYRFTISGLNIPDGSVLKFNYEYAYWGCYMSYEVKSGTLSILSGQLDTFETQFERTITSSGGYTITDLEFYFASPVSQVQTITSGTITDVQFGNLKFKFS